MLTLMLLRHAKAAPGGQGGDAERPLTDDGKRDAGRLGALVRSKQIVPDLALVSAAKRAQQTFAAFAAEVGREIPIRSDAGLYSATPVQLRTTLQGLATTDRCMLVVGHNPAIAEAALSLATSGDAETLARLRQHFPPCSLAVLVFDADEWRAMKTGRLDLFVTPEDVGR